MGPAVRGARTLSCRGCGRCTDFVGTHSLPAPLRGGCQTSMEARRVSEGGLDSLADASGFHPNGSCAASGFSLALRPPAAEDTFLAMHNASPTGTHPMTTRRLLPPLL